MKNARIRLKWLFYLTLLFTTACGGDSGGNNGNSSSAIFEKKFGGSAHDSGESIGNTADGGYILLGYTESFGIGGFDMYLVKTDSDGNEQWSNTFGGTGNDFGSSVQQTTDGGYILLGSTKSFGSGGQDLYLVKTDATGYEEWSKTFGGAADDEGNSVQQTTDGGYILIGSYITDSTSGSEIYIVKTGANGMEEWSTTIGEPDSDDRGHSIRQTSDGGYILAGEIKGDVPFGGFSYLTDMYLGKIDADGNLLWGKKFGGEDWDAGKFAQETSDGGYILFGHRDRETQFYLVKTDKDGNEQWSNTYVKYDYNRAYGAAQTSDGGFILIGELLEVTETTSNSQSGNLYMYALRVDASGEKAWDKTFAAGDEAAGRSVVISADGNFTLLGSANSSSSSWDMYLVKINSSGN